MDKLRSIQYFLAAAESGSFSAAARRLDVSVAAVSKLVNTLESRLGVKLFERRTQGLTLSAGGAAYLETCKPALAMLEDAEQQAMATVSNRARGMIVVGVQPVIAQEVLTQSLTRFNAMYPEIQLDIRFLMRITEEQSRGVDVFLLLGWPEQVGDLVQRHIGAASFVVCAAPAYWKAHGMPKHPLELEDHNCLCIRGNTGTVMDLWHFRRGDEEVSVTARGWLQTDNAHRDMIRDTVIAGGGVARILDWHWRQGRELANGTLIPALTDWELDEVPPVNVLYPQSVRRVPRVRLFIDFITQVFHDIEMQRQKRQAPSRAPSWLKSHRARASTTLGRTP